ncbi:DUF4862 family protein [Microbacteriaceae bacterium VKM Ac-2854]|nr:DUF4862 family protein [Microbacteriaceae bacterium VKM Ac-2854]
MRLLVGAYPADPSLAFLDAVGECDGFEIPFGSSYVVDEPAMLRRLARSGSHVFTLLPATLEGGFGLASPDARRFEALALVRRALSAALSVNAAAGRTVVEAVLLHSAPRVRDVAAHRGAFAASLAELASWDWGEVEPVIEHCDSHAGPAPLKGFLDLASELGSLGVAINWGRSYLDTGSVAGPVLQARTVHDAGLLRILGVSGVADWADAHAPVGRGLLTEAALAEFLAVGAAPLVIVKVAGSLAEVRHSVRATQKALARASAPAPH